MKSNIHVLLLVSSVLFASKVASNPAKWSRFIKTKSQDDVVISFRQMRKNLGWSIEWQVKNGSDLKVEPILISRHYVCKNGESVELNQQSLGVYLPGTHRKGGIKDKGICPNSKIKFVEIKSEILKLPLDENSTISSP